MSEGRLGEIYAVSFVLELPFDLGLREQTGGILFEDRGAEWDGWPEEAVRTVMQLPQEQELPPHLGPGTRWMLRRSWVRTHAPLLAADEAFTDWVEPLLDKHQRRIRSKTINHWRKKGISKPLTVAALTRFVGPEMLPGGTFDTNARRLYDRVRSDFDDILSLLGLSSGVWWLGPVTEREMPNVVPMIIELAGPHEPSVNDSPPVRQGLTFGVPLHTFGPNLLDEEIVSEAQLQGAADMRNAFNAGDLSSLPVFRMLHESGADLNVGRPGQAVVLSSAAVELFVTFLLREGGKVRGWEHERLHRALRANLKNRIEDHLGPLLGARIDLVQGTDAWAGWWAGGYQARNDFVHEGQAPTRDRAVDAWKTVVDLMSHVRETLGADPELSQLLAHMPFEPQLTEPEI